MFVNGFVEQKEEYPSELVDAGDIPVGWHFRHYCFFLKLYLFVLRLPQFGSFKFCFLFVGTVYLIAFHCSDDQ